MLKQKLLYISFLVLSVIIITEVTVRVFKDWIPPNLVEHLSSNAVELVYETRGPVTENSNIYHYLPNEIIKYREYINIDENGFRNSVHNQKEVDLILLGDSIIFAKGSKIDLGDLFRKDNISVINMGMPGYAPQHYKSVYQEYIIEKSIKHKFVLICLFVGNDFNDSERYPYTYGPNGKGSDYFPWTVNLLIGAIKIFNERQSYPTVEESKYQIDLPYKRIGVNYLWYPGHNDEMQTKTVGALKNIISLSESMNALTKIVVIPSPASVYGYKIFPTFRHYYDSQVSIVKDLKEDLRYDKVEIYDPTVGLSDDIEHKFLYLADSEAHFNEIGIEAIYNLIFKNLFKNINQ